MPKYFLTTYFAHSFVQDCALAQLPQPTKGELIRCSNEMLQNYLDCLQTKDSSLISNKLFVAMTYLKDCQSLLLQAVDERVITQEDPIFTRYHILEGRLVHMFESTAVSEGGQLRMLG